MSRVGSASAAPVPDRPQAPEAPKGDRPPPESRAEGRSEAPPSEGDFQQFFDEAMADQPNPLGDQLDQQQQMLQDMARSNVRVLTSSDVGRAGQDMGKAEGTQQNLTQAQSDAARQSVLDQSSQQTQTRDSFQRGVSADQSAAMRASDSQKALESGQRYVETRKGTEQGGQADRAGDKVSKQSGENPAQWQARMLKLSKPSGDEVQKRFEQLPNQGQLTPRQAQVVKEHMAKQMQMQKLQQMLEKAKAEGADKEQQQFLENMLSKLKADTENPPPELAMAQGAEESSKAEEGKETEETKAEEGEESGESEGAEGLQKFETVDQGGQSGEGMGGQQGGAMDQGAQLPQVLPPMVDSNLSLMQTMERRDDVFTVGGTGASPEAQRSEQLGRMGVRQAALLWMGAGETFRLHGSNGFQAIRMRYHGGGHSLDPQYKDDVGQANVEQGGVRVVGHRSGVTANIYQLEGAMKGVDAGQEYVNFRGQRWSTAGIQREMRSAAMVRSFHAHSVTPGRTQSPGSYNRDMIA